MKKLIIHVIFLFAIIGNVHQVEAQFLKKLGKRAEDAAKEAVLRKSEQKVNRETERAMDTILDGNKGKRNKKTKSSKQNEETNENDEISQEENSENDFGVYSNFTFIPGNKLLFYDDFAADALGDFPANWETGGSGEVVNLKNSDSKWLSIVRRSGYLPTMKNALPENYTIEFDLTNNGYYEGKSSSKLMFVFMTKKAYAGGSGGTLAEVELQLSHNGFKVSSVSNFGGELDIRVASSLDRNMPEFINNTVHISIAVNKKRLRMWVNEEKMVDSPNLIQANIGRYFIIQAMDVLPEQGHFVGISNFKIAESTEDLRSLLLKNGKFSTTGIYFDTAAATVKKESYGILLDIANMLRDNDDINLQIIGHTDNKGAEDYNQTLSEKRAAAVKEILVEEFGIREDRLQFKGKGETEAVDDNATEKGRANNRRVEFIKI
ncbi:OmpA family protein [Mariniflexile fucanivorans]|uniref:OmpA family protein n=1 Tax=Mariniflexile fucanivorans TaxID=264023 RepID=A0A4R1RQQ4_9FLAO|nr:OmpA family protein [Mariniflexile fucanivorans]TCL68725.1 OmpA family protein [Mariniflexile fucanivorans]